MTAQEWAFAIVGVLGSVAAIRLVTSKNVVHAALWLVVTLATVAAAYLILGAEFVGWVQVLIYVGAIVVLLLFALMLTKAPIGREALDNQQRGLAAIVGLGVLVGLIFLLQGAFGGKRIHTVPTVMKQVGTALFRDYVLPFEVVSVLLLAALVGAIVLARKDEGE
ncbi:MAG TPA: NADH-quinone oxidoreductase subunit J [Actinomycetota bacterium]